MGCIAMHRSGAPVRSDAYLANLARSSADFVSDDIPRLRDATQLELNTDQFSLATNAPSFVDGLLSLKRLECLHVDVHTPVPLHMFSSLLQCLPSFDRLTTFAFNAAVAGHPSVTLPGLFVGAFSRLTSLRLRNTWMGDVGLRAVAALLATTTCLRELDVTGKFVGSARFDSPTTWGGAGEQENQDSLLALADGLSRNSSLKELELFPARVVQCETLLAFVDAVQQHPRLEKFPAYDNCVRHTESCRHERPATPVATAGQAHGYYRRACVHVDTLARAVSRNRACRAQQAEAARCLVPAWVRAQRGDADRSPLSRLPRELVGEIVRAAAVAERECARASE